MLATATKTETKTPKKTEEPKVKNAATVSWLQQSIHKSRNEIFSEVKTVTPAFAEVLLSNNPDNRRLREIKMAQLVGDMRHGRWTFNGEPIIIAKTGELNDGQHRLQAIVDAKVCLPMMFVFGVERSSRTTLDQGASRNAGDYLHMDGVPNSSQLAAITRMIISYQAAGRENFGRRGHVTPAEILQRAEGKDKMEIMTSARYALNHAGRMKKYATASVIGFCHYTLLNIDIHDGMAFMDALCTGENLQRGDAIMTARERLLALEHRSEVIRTEIIFRAWNAYREQRTMTKIPVHGRFPELI